MIDCYRLVNSRLDRCCVSSQVTLLEAHYALLAIVITMGNTLLIDVDCEPHTQLDQRPAWL